MMLFRLSGGSAKNPSCKFHWQDQCCVGPALPCNHAEWAIFLGYPGHHPVSEKQHPVTSRLVRAIGDVPISNRYYPC